MRTVKPLRLGVLTRPFGYQQQTHLGVLVYTLIDFTGATPKLVPEAELTSRLLPQMDCEGILDLVLPKVYPEFLVSGSAYTSHQQDKTRCGVRIQVGDLEKNLIVSGDRYWIDNRATQPQPFEQMPITWANAYGGRDFAENPGGKGLDRELVNGTWALRLPNIESTTERFHSPDKHCNPAGTSPIFLTRPRRYGHIGTSSDSWMKNDITSFFPDMDLRLFNAAEPDQRWTDRNQLPLGAPFAIWNMHPDEPCWTGSIPDWVARCFVQQQQDDGQIQFLEVAVRPTTIWFLPHIKHAVMMYHGSIPVTQTYGEDVTAVIPAIEYKDQTHNIDYYQQIFTQRNDMETGALYALRDKELIPKALMGDWLDTRPAAENALMRNTQKYEQIKRQELRDKLTEHKERHPENENQDIADIMPELYGPPFPQSPEYFPELHERMKKIKFDTEQEMEQERTKALRAARNAQTGDSEQTARAIAMLEEKPKAPSQQELNTALADLDKQQQTLEQEWDKARAQNNKLQQNDAEFKKLQAQAREAKQALGKMNLYTAHFLPAGISVSKHEADQKREKIIARQQAGQPLKGLDLSGANLSGLAFVEIDFTGSDLSQTDLSNTHFTRCLLDECILVRATVRDAIFDTCDFTRTNLAALTVTDCNFSHSHFNNVVLDQSSFANCDFRSTRWANILLNTKAHFSLCRFDSADIQKSIFTECTFDQVSFNTANFSQIVFQQSRLDQVNFDESQISSAGFLSSTLSQISFARSQMEGVSFMHKLSMDTCSFNSASMKGCCFKGTTATHLTAKEVRCSHCDFSNSDIRDTDFTGATLHQCVLKSADLRGCSFRQVDFTASVLLQADLRGTDLSHVNFCTADVSETHMDHTTIVHHIYTKHTKIYPVRKNMPAFWEKHV